jgi:hypothetical protein
MGSGAISNTQVAGSGRGRRGENLECDQVGDIASARRVARDDDACKFLMFGSVIGPA